MNLVQLASDLEFVPKEQLAQMSQDPNTSYPPYLVLAEIQRRTQNDKAYAAMQPQPTNTVAEEVVNEFVQPKGLQAGIPSGSAPTDVFSPESSGMPASAPMQMAASGGITGYNMGGPLEQSFANLNQNNTEETIPVESLSESQRAEILQNSQGLTTAQKVQLGLGAASLALLVTPVPGARIAAGATKLLQLGIRGGSGLKGMYQGLRAKRLLKAGQKELNRKGGLPATTPYNPNTVLQTGKEALRRELPPKIIGGTGLAGTTYGLLDGDSPMSLFPNEQQEPEVNNKTNIVDPTQAAIDAVGGDSSNNITSLSDFVSAKDKAERRRAGLDMAQLGGVILSSRNLNDLGKGITGIASNMQTRDAAEGMAGAQQAYYEAQTGKLEAETIALPAKELRAEIDSYSKYLKILQDQNDGSEETTAKITQVQSYISALGQRLATMQGYASADAATTRDQRLKASGISVT